VVRPYKTRTAFTNLSSLPTIYLNEYLIDDEEVLEYSRDGAHKAQHVPFEVHRRLVLRGDSILHFFIPKEKVEEIRGKDGKADREVNRRLQ